MKATGRLSLICTLIVSFGLVSMGEARQQETGPSKTYEATLIPSQYNPSKVFQLPSGSRPKVRLASWTPQGGEPQNPPSIGSFPPRGAKHLPAAPVPQIESIQRTAKDVRPRQDPAKGSRGEYIYDGNDRGQRIVVDNQWKIHGLDTEDTIGHFDTQDGRRLVSPSNRVEIYAPRFSAVRQVADYSKTRFFAGPYQAKQKMPLQLADGTDFSSTTKQHVQVDRYTSSKRASTFRDTIRGLTSENLTLLLGSKGRIEPYEDMAIVRFGKFSSQEGTRLKLGMMSANVWRDDMGLQVTAANATPVIVNDVYKVQQIESIESDGDNSILRVVKVASRMSGRPGDTIEFTIRFDNISAKEIGNVTIVDNLTKRLEYIEDSAQSSMDANFITESNAEGSLILKWEIIQPLPASKGGVVKFKCRIR